MSKKESTNSSSTFNTTQHQTVTPNNPAYVDQGLQGLAGQVMNLSNADPYSFVAGPNTNLQQAGQNAAGLTGSPWNYDAAADLTRGVAQANSPQTSAVRASRYINSYMDPYMNDVVNSSLADYNVGAGQTRAQNQLALAGDTTFGGSGGAIQTALSNDAIDRGRASLTSGLRSAGFSQALGAAQQDANRQQNTNDMNAQLMGQGADRTLNAAGQLANIAGQYGDQQRANIASQGGIGAILQQLAQNRAQAPLSLLGTQAALFSGLPLGLVHGQTEDGTANGTQTGQSTTKTSDPMGTFGGLLSGAGSLASGLGAMGLGFGAGAGGLGSLAMLSDRRLKRDIVKLGERADGLAVYAYRYLWSKAQEVGLMAQEVLGVKPEAVVTLPSGYLALDYGKL
jgi:hypothetical protein